ncbi:putative O-glycosylation ligase, exosortase A system-associated [Inmirania thermothiophila]|uniref:Putative O-glycosylation ligase (Exosortase A-associated) n=1 Tax=Inmirania thermothiophila TaxID=1750597 RepID=A0A3N1XWQ5_9GAMM|nr:putative O-glycosylation ligase, exosortase A system-associated [Inmirania thermothiophila]ROR29622.1 putative O-glycosylation ligase (exosortase A-associated) [Inmirania thermothiophila]
MRDLAVLALLAGACLVTVYRPWLGVLALAFFGYANPHRYAWGFATTLPVYQILLAVAFLAAIGARERQGLPRDWRIPVFYLLWLWFLVTTAVSPIGWAAWPKLWEVSKVYTPLILSLILITGRERLFWLLATIGFSFGLLAAKGGIFGITRGFHYRVWGPEGTMYGGNNEFGIATLVAVPLLVLVARELKGTSGWRRLVRWGAMAAVPLAVASVISSWSRGGLIALGALSLVMWWHSRHKLVLTVAVLLAALAAPRFLPEAWFARMETISTYQQDNSAMNRIEAWTDGIRYVLEHPVTGAGFDGWRYVTKRDWHSAYVEILAEHGFPGALLWGLLVFGTLASLTRIAWQARRDERIAWARDYAVMMRASLIAYLAGALTLGITYWDLLYQLVFCAVLLKAFVRREVEAEAAASPTEAARPQGAAA